MMILGRPGGSFVDVAVVADEENRKKLAVMLLVSMTPTIFWFILH